MVRHPKRCFDFFQVDRNHGRQFPLLAVVVLWEARAVLSSFFSSSSSFSCSFSPSITKSNIGDIMLHFYNLATVALHQFIVPSYTPYLFNRLGQLRIKSLWHCLDKLQKHDRLLKGKESTGFFVAAFAPNLPGNNNKKWK